MNTSGNRIPTVATVTATANPAHNARVAETWTDGCANRCHEHEAEQAYAAIEQHHRRRQRLGTRRRRRVGDPDHVTANVAREEIVEEGCDEEG